MVAAGDPPIRSHRAVPEDEEGQARPSSQGRVRATILFDGVCNLCNGFVQFVIARDPGAYFHFAPLSSETAGRLLKEAGVGGPIPDSMVLVEDGQVYFRSDAPLRVSRRLAFPWSLLAGFLVIPRFIRDWAYDVIA